MKIFLTGATGYIAQRLLPVLLDGNHEVICFCRDANRFDRSLYKSDASLQIIEGDLQDLSTIKIPADIDAAYYLVHSMSAAGDFSSVEEQGAANFVNAIDLTNAKHIIYLGGIANDKTLSPHLASRKKVEQILSSSKVPLTALRAGIIVGSGSASFEIIRDLAEKLPVMIAPKWLHTKCQPIAIRNVIEFLYRVLLQDFTYNKHFDIYGPDILTYKEMLLQFAEVRGLKRFIFTVPVMTPRLSSYWLYFVTSTSYALARNLVDSMKVDVVATPNELSDRLGIELRSYKDAIRMAFDKIEQQMVLSTWKDAWGKSLVARLSQQVQVPVHGVFVDRKEAKSSNPQLAAERIFSIGGISGWYYADWLWEIRGFLDKLFGGVGLKRGRKHPKRVVAGESLDFWRVIYANREEQRLMLYAEMKLPGEAWLEFNVKDNVVTQTATFRPLGIAGRLYWYAMLPFHHFIFKGMINKITE